MGWMSEIKIGQVIKRLIREKRTSLKEISRKTEIPYSTLHTWHENRQPKDIVKARKLADHLGVSLHELLFDLPDEREKNETKESEPTKDDEFFKGKFEIIVRRIDQ